MANSLPVDTQLRSQPPGAADREAGADAKRVSIDRGARLVAQCDAAEVAAAEQARSNALQRDRRLRAEIRDGVDTSGGRRAAGGEIGVIERPLPAFTEGARDRDAVEVRVGGAIARELFERAHRKQVQELVEVLDRLADQRIAQRQRRALAVIDVGRERPATRELQGSQSPGRHSDPGSRCRNRRAQPACVRA